MLNLFRKPKITFEQTIPGVDRIMPMIPARELKHAWVRKAQDSLANLRKDPEWGMHKLVHTARCPGIFKLMRYGWVLRTWQDIIIDTTRGEINNFGWQSAIDQKTLNGEDAIGMHGPMQLATFMDEWPENTLRSLLKVYTGWRCNVPKGYYLLEMPVAYSEENRFTTVPGFFSHEQGPAQMNVQLLWHNLNQKTLIKAGTPIAQYILVPHKEMDMMITGKTCDDNRFFEIANNHRFVKNYAEMKKLYRE